MKRYKAGDQVIIVAGVEAAPFPGWENEWVPGMCAHVGTIQRVVDETPLGVRFVGIPYRYPPHVLALYSTTAYDIETKDTNPKDAVGTRKAPVSTVSMPFVAEMGVAMLEGARKYGRHNYRVAGVRASVYVDAAMRHIMQWYEGEDIDQESGMSHLVKAAACMAVVRDAQMRGKLVDDRPPSTQAGWMDALNKAAAAVVDKYPDAPRAYVRGDEDNG